VSRQLGDGVGQAVAEVERRGVVSAAEAQEGLTRRAPRRLKRHDAQTELLEQEGEHGPSLHFAGAEEGRWIE